MAASTDMNDVADDFHQLFFFLSGEERKLSVKPLEKYVLQRNTTGTDIDEGFQQFSEPGSDGMICLIKKYLIGVTAALKLGILIICI